MSTEASRLILAAQQRLQRDTLLDFMLYLGRLDNQADLLKADRDCVEQFLQKQWREHYIQPET